MRRIILIVIAVVVVLVAFVAAWVLIRGSQARDELASAVPLAHRIEKAAVSGDSTRIDSDVRTLQARAASAVALTSDPIWRAAEVVPGLGHNLTVVRESAALVHGLSTDAIPPLAGLAGTVKVKDLVPTNGAIDLGVFSMALAPVSAARESLDSARAKAKAIDVDGTVPVVHDAASKLVDLVESTAGTIDAVDTAARLLPGMLGADGPRTYLLFSLNSSELRTPGGIPGAIAVVDADAGKLTLGLRTSAEGLRHLKTPALPLSPAELTLYNDRLGEYMQDVVSTPNFARSGQLAQAFWKAKTGQTIDGIVAIDPVALGYIMKATGPVAVGSGVTLSSANAATFLLSTVYAQIPDTAQQDIFFAGVTKSIFAVLTGGKVDSAKLLDGLSRSAAENRVHVWSAHPSEQKVLGSSSLAGALPRSTNASSAFGVYLNDATGAKMDFYLRNTVEIASGECRADDRPNFDVSVTLKSTAPLDAATSLPTYVTGRYAFGVAPGRVRTNVYVYAPPGAEVFSVQVNGKESAFVSAPLDGHPVVGVVVEMGPGESSTMKFRFVAKAGAPTAVSLQHTPMSSAVKTDLSGSVDCAALSN